MARLFTDAMLGYRGLDADYVHGVIDHAIAYVDGRVHTNGLENFWSLLKRALAEPTSALNRSISSATP